VRMDEPSRSGTLAFNHVIAHSPQRFRIGLRTCTQYAEGDAAGKFSLFLSHIHTSLSRPPFMLSGIISSVALRASHGCSNRSVPLMRTASRGPSTAYTHVHPHAADEYTALPSPRPRHSRRSRRAIAHCVRASHSPLCTAAPLSSGKPSSCSAERSSDCITSSVFFPAAA
jgi:hypothetical protein